MTPECKVFHQLYLRKFFFWNTIVETNQKQEKQIKEILNTMNEGLVACDQSGNFFLYNNAAENILGPLHNNIHPGKWPKAFQLYQMNRQSLLQPQQHPIYNTMQTGQACTQEFFVKSPDQNEGKIVTGTAKPILDNSGKQEGVMALFRDVTEERQLEEKLLQSQKMEALGTLAGGVAHDFNNLLTLIIGYGQLIDSNLNEKNSMKAYISEILETAFRASSLTEQLLLFSRKKIFQPQIFDFNEMIQDMEKMLRRIIGEDIQITFQYTDETVNVCFDRSQLEQVLLNLVVNARDAMPGGGSLKINTRYCKSPPIKLEKVQVPPYLLLEVIDSGHGIPEELQSHIFEPFFTSKAPGKGTGLGLATVYGIIKQMKGDIQFKSTPEGTSFSIYIPMTNQKPSLKKSIATLSEDLTGHEKILVVEDSQRLLKLIEKVLSGQGYTVVTSDQAKKALNLLKNDSSFDLLLTDIVMPELNGIELANQLLQYQPKLKILYMTGYATETINQYGMISDDITLLQKPFKVLDLLQQTKEVLKK